MIHTYELGSPGPHNHFSFLSPKDREIEKRENANKSEKIISSGS